ncbi:MAG: 6-phosphofructokinase [Chlorobi bacterium]|nr:6-phosphofructokinase [Chlorobiota bacterium]
MKVAILTGGGDCPGMNAFIRSVTRSAINLKKEVEVWGVLDGWAGMIAGSYRQLDVLDTAGISRLGGTILGTLRAPEIKEQEEMRERVVNNFLEAGFDAFISCGGSGSLRAAHDLNRRLRAKGEERQILFTSASIDNDVANTYGTSIGFYSAIERSMEMMEWIRDTASAHRRVYVVGSMGRNSAYLPVYAGLTTGAEYVIRPDEQVDYDRIVDMIEARDRDTRIIVSEGYPRTLDEITAILSTSLEKLHSAHEIRTVDMGYFQRGGMASVTDVLRANWIGHCMVQAAFAGEKSSFFGAFHIGATPNKVTFEEAIRPEATHEDIPRAIMEMMITLR